MTPAKLGQHWLIDKRVCREIADSADLRPSDTCIEIGGGKGALTRFLLPLCRRLIVYEIDSNWANHLRELAPSWIEKAGIKLEFEVRELDALKIEWTRDFLKLAPDEKTVVAGNLPYYITSPLLLNLSYSRLDIRHAVFLIQKEVAERITAPHGDTNYSRLTVSLGAFMETKRLFKVPPDAFKPPPKVTSSVIKMTPLEKPLADPEIVDIFEYTVKVSFHMRRKTLKNNLVAGFPGLKATDAENILQCMGINPNARAQEVRIVDFVTLARMLKSRQ